MKFNTIFTLLLVTAAVLTLLTAGCGNDVKSKNLEQLYAENGVPVKAVLIKSTLFSKSLEFNAVLTGVKESSAFSTLSEKIESINYGVGDNVERDAVVLTFPSDNPQTKYYQAKLAYENAQTTFQRIERLYESGGLSRQEFENAETSFKVTEADWNSVRQSVKVKAPISGIITRINFRETENVKEDDELFTVAQIDRVKARIWVSDRDIDQFKNGLKATAKWNEYAIEGEVVQVDMSMNQDRKAFAVDIIFGNPDHRVRTGVTADIVVRTDMKESSIVIDRKDLIIEDPNHYVYLCKNGMAKKQLVEVGTASGTEIEVISGLNDGDSLVVEGQMLLSDNTKLNLIDE